MEDAVGLLETGSDSPKHRFDRAYREMTDAIGKTEVPNKFLAALRFKLVGAIIVQTSFLCVSRSNINCNKLFQLLFRGIEVLALSPTLFGNVGTPIAILVFLLVAFMIYAGWTCYIIQRYYKGKQVKHKTLQFWVLVSRIFLIAPATIIGKYLGHFLAVVSESTILTMDVGIMWLAIIVSVLWCWLIILASSIYNASPILRLNDLAQIWRLFSAFEIFISFVPFIYALAPDLLRALLGHIVGSAIFSALSLLFFAGSSLLILTQYPFIYPEANWTCMFVLLASFFISTIPIFNIMLPTHMDITIVAVFAATAASWFIVKYGFVHRAPDSANEITERQKIDETDSDDYEGITAKQMSFAVQDVVLSVFFVSSILFMMYMSSHIAKRSPMTPPVRDVMHNKFKMGASIRGRSSFSHYQFANIVCVALLLSLLVIMIFARNSVNIRKTVFIYSIMAVIRSLSGLMTSLPPPCAGSPNCPCANPDVLSRVRNANTLTMALSWIEGLGIFASLPQCGNWIISGQAMFMWIALKTVVDSINAKIRRPFRHLFSVCLTVCVLAALAYIVVSRSHYSIDVFFGILLPELLWLIYSTSQKITRKTEARSNLVLILVRWLEQRDKANDPVFEQDAPAHESTDSDLEMICEEDIIDV